MPDGRRLLLDARLPARHRVSRRRRARADRDARCWSCLTLFGALPVYSRVAAVSPHGQGSISVLEERLPRWRGKAFVLACSGSPRPTSSSRSRSRPPTRRRTSSRTRSCRPWLDHPVVVTLVLLIAALGAVFLKGFKEAIGVAVVLVARVPRAQRRRHRLRAVGDLCASRVPVRAGRARCSTQHGNPVMMLARRAAAVSRSSRSACRVSRPASR